jgi:hypothetical protein
MTRRRARLLRLSKGAIQISRQPKGAIQTKRQRIASIVIASASIFVVGITLAAQDKYTLKSPSAISFSEFRATSCGR